MSLLLNWLDEKLFGIRRVVFGGEDLPDRPAISFEGAGVSAVEDDVANNRTKVTISGAGTGLTGDEDGLALITATTTRNASRTKRRTDTTEFTAQTTDATPLELIVADLTGIDSAFVIASVLAVDAAGQTAIWERKLLTANGFAEPEAGTVLPDPAPWATGAAVLSLDGSEIKLTLTGEVATTIRWYPIVQVQMVLA